MSRYDDEHDDDQEYEYDDGHGYDNDHGYDYIAGSRQDDGHDDDHQHSLSGLVSQSQVSKGYLFDIQNGVVTGVSEYERGFVETESIDRTETYSFDGSVVTKIETERYGVETSTYADVNGDGIYEKVSHAWTPTSTAAPAGRSYDDWYEYGGFSDDYELHHAGQAVIVSGMFGDEGSQNAGSVFTIESTSGSLVEGTKDIDTARYALASDSVRLSKRTDGTLQLTSSSGQDAADVLSGIERIEFSDLTIDLTIKDQLSVIDQSQLTRIQELYVAFFNRVPDGGGLAYWTGELAKGISIDEIADGFYSAGIQYSELTGFSSSMSHGDFVNVVYKNVLGREEGADLEGLKYWSDRLVTGEATRGSLVSSILDSAHTFDGDPTWGWVASLLDNKALVANTFSVEYGVTFKDPTEAIARGMQIAALVGSTEIDTALTAIGILG